MNYLKTKINFKFIALITAIFMLLINGGFILINSTKNLINSYVSAASIPTEVSFGNGSFTNPDSSNYPISPNSWSKIEGSSNVVSGIISLEQELFETNRENNYQLDFKPYTYTGMNDLKVLMLNSKQELGQYGYRSNSFSLASSGYFIISFKAYTQAYNNISSLASAKLTGSTSVTNLDSSKILINTNGSWQDYYFFVETDGINSQSLNLEFWLGDENLTSSRGAVFFDEVSVTSYSSDTFYSMLSGGNNYSYVNLKSGQVNFLSNPSFENGLNGWTLIDSSTDTSANNSVNGVYYVDDNYDENATEISTSPTNANLYNNQKALLIYNKNEGAVGFESEKFVINRNRLYKLSFLAKTGTITGTSFVNLVETSPYGDNSSYEKQTFTISNISTVSYANSVTGNWQEYSFYIKGNSYKNVEVNLELWLGSLENLTKGYVFFDNFTLNELTSTDYATGSSSGTVANLNQITGTLEIANGSFNEISITDLNNVAPYTPNDFTLYNKNENNFKSGVVNPEYDLSEIGLPSVTSLSGLTNNNNMLMINNIANNYVAYRSLSFSLNADSYYKISVSIQTKNLDTAKAGLRLLQNGNIVGEFANITSDDIFTTYSLLIKTGFSNENFVLELNLGANQIGTGFAFFDNVKLESNLTEETYNASLLNSKKINLATADFTNIEPNKKDGLYTPYDFTVNNNNSENSNYVVSGIVDTNNFTSIPELSGLTTNPGSPENSSGNVLMISSAQDVHYSYEQVRSVTLLSGRFYKISVFVKTLNLSQNDDNKVLISGSSDKYYEYGASISASGISSAFTGINTNGVFKEYIMYVNCTTDTNVSLNLSLGNSNALTSGYVFFSEANVEAISQSDYINGIEVLEADNAPDNIMAIGSTDISDESDDTTENNGSINFDFIVVPTLITCLAILVAVICSSIRLAKNNRPKKVVVQASNYDREKTVANKRERKKEIAQLKLEQEELKKELDVLNYDYEILNEETITLSEEESANKTEIEIADYKKTKCEELKAQKHSEIIEKQSELNKLEEKLNLINKK